MKILIVDKACNRTAYEENLKGLGHDSLFASNDDLALSIICENRDLKLIVLIDKDFESRVRFTLKNFRRKVPIIAGKNNVSPGKIKQILEMLQK